MTSKQRAEEFSALLRGPRKTRRSTPKALATRKRLVEAAVVMFADRGYERTSLRELGQEVGLTTGAIYAHFRNKADLLAAAVAHTIADHLERPQNPGGRRSFVDSTTHLFTNHPSQAELRTLLLDGAAAAKADDAVRDRLREVQLDRLAAWTAVAKRHQEAGDMDPTVDAETWIKLQWAMEFGLVIYDIFGIEPPDPGKTGELLGRFLETLVVPTDSDDA